MPEPRIKITIEKRDKPLVIAQGESALVVLLRPTDAAPNQLQLYLVADSDEAKTMILEAINYIMERDTGFASRLVQELQADDFADQAFITAG